MKKDNPMKAIWTKTAFLSALLFSTHTVSAQLTVANTETLVNSTTASTQQAPAVAMDTSGRYAVVWESELEDGSGYGVYAKIYNADHSVRVGDFLVNTTNTTNDQRNPDVAITPDGTIAIVWQSNHLNPQRWISYIKFYDIDGVNIGVRSTLDNSTLNHQYPVVAASDDQFAVAFMTNLAGDNIYGIQGKYYDNTGAAIGTEFVVDSTAEHLSYPTVAVDSSGNAIYAWQHYDVSGGNVTNIRAINMDNLGTPTSSVYSLTTGSSNNKTYPSLARASTGEFIAVYSKFNADGDHYGIYGRKFSATGGVVGGEFRINESTNGSQDHPQINCTRDGAFYSVTWTDESNDGELQGVYARVFDYSLGYLNSEQLINTTTDNRQMLSDVSLSRDSGEVVYVWQGGLRKASTTGLDPEDYGVYTSALELVDNTPPIAVCQNITVFLDATGNVTISGVDVDGGSSDNIGIESYDVTPSSFTCSEIGANSVELIVTDAAGLSDTCSAIVTVQDVTAPAVVCQDITVYLDGTGSASIVAADVDGGSSDNCGITSLSVNQSSFTCADIGANTVTLTVSDAQTLSASCNATVTVIDSVSPTAVCQNLTVFLDGSGNASIAGFDMDGGSTDNCGISAYSVSPSSFTCADIGANNVTLTVTDFSGNNDACTGVVTVVDSVSPVAVCQDITVYLDATGNATITSGDLDGGSTDNCGIASLALSQSTFTCANIGTNAVTLTVTDLNGNSDACSSTVTVVDSISPTAVCQDITMYLDGSGNASITTGDVDGGSTDNCGIASTSISQSSFTCSDIGANSVVFTVTDVNGNSNVCTALVTVQDTTSPTAMCQDITVYLDGSGNATITAGDVDGGSTDNCAIGGLSVSPSAFTCADLGSNLVTLTVTDVNGNIGTCTSTVTVADTVSPVTPVLADLSDECTVTLTAPTTTDNCGGTVTGTTTDPMTYTGDGSYIVTWTFDDGNGNTTTATQNVLIDDVTAPTTPTLADVTAECSTTVTAPTTTDNCAGTVTGTTSDPLTYTGEGTYVITWTFDDGNGNNTTATQNVIIDDITAPVVPTLSDVTGECSATATAPTATDNCVGSITGTTSDPLTYTGEGTYVITWTFDDGNGNTSSTTQNVIIDDITAPVTPTLAVLTDECSVTATAPTTTDNCAGTITGTTSDPLTYNTDGTYIITWTFDDGNGNTTTATQNVIIDDVTPPTASNVDTAYAECIGDVAVDISLVNDAADNCGSPVVTYVGDVASNGSCNDTIVRTYNVADGGGNSIDVTQIIIVNDVTPPTASNPVTLNLVCLDDVPSTTGAESWVIDEADNCAVPTVTWISDVSSNGTGCNDTITRTFEVADACGNAITVSQLIIVNDDIEPTVDLATLEDEVGFCDVTPATPTATDNCAGTINGVPDVTFPINTLGTTVVTWTFTDDCGNTTMQTQNVIIEQIEVGTYFAPDGATIVASNNDSGVTFQWIDCETNTILPGETNQNFEPTYSSDFAVIVTQDGCSDTSDCVTITGVGLTTISDETIVLFPNPSTGQFTIQYDGSLKSVEMFDVLGRLVLTESDIEDGFIDASILAPGKYMVRVKTETDQSMVQPIVIGQK